MTLVFGMESSPSKLADAAAESVLRSSKHVSIAQLSPSLISNLSPTEPVIAFKAIVTLIWPYSASSRSLAILLAEPDFRLRRSRGQVKVHFAGACAEAIAEALIRSGDEVTLTLQGVEFVSAVENGASETSGASLEWELRFISQALLEVRQQGSSKLIHTDGTQEASRAGTPPLPETIDMTNLLPYTPQPVIREPRAPIQEDTVEFQSPAFIKRARTSYGSLFETGYDVFGESEDKDRRKKQRLSRLSSTWRYMSRSPSPEVETRTQEDEERDALSSRTSPEPTKAPTPPRMMDEGCQTIDLDPEAMSSLFATPAKKIQTFESIKPTSTLESTSTAGTQTIETPGTKSGLEVQITAHPAPLPPDTGSFSSPNQPRKHPSSPRIAPVDSQSLPLVSPFPHSNEDPFTTAFGTQDETRNEISAVKPPEISQEASEEHHTGLSRDGLHLSDVPNSSTAVAMVVEPLHATEDVRPSDPYGHWASSVTAFEQANEHLEAEMRHSMHPAYPDLVDEETSGHGGSNPYYGEHHISQHEPLGFSSVLPHSEDLAATPPVITDGLLHSEGYTNALPGFIPLHTTAFAPLDEHQTQRQDSHQVEQESKSMSRSQSSQSAVIDLTESDDEESSQHDPLAERADEFKSSTEVVEYGSIDEEHEEHDYDDDEDEDEDEDLDSAAQYYARQDGQSVEPEDDAEGEDVEDYVESDDAGSEIESAEAASLSPSSPHRKMSYEEEEEDVDGDEGDYFDNDEGGEEEEYDESEEDEPSQPASFPPSRPGEPIVIDLLSSDDEDDDKNDVASNPASSNTGRALGFENNQIETRPDDHSEREESAKDGHEEVHGEHDDVDMPDANIKPGDDKQVESDGEQQESEGKEIQKQLKEEAAHSPSTTGEISMLANATTMTGTDGITESRELQEVDKSRASSPPPAETQHHSQQHPLAPSPSPSYQASQDIPVVEEDTNKEQNIVTTDESSIVPAERAIDDASMHHEEMAVLTDSHLDESKLVDDMKTTSGISQDVGPASASVTQIQDSLEAQEDDRDAAIVSTSSNVAEALVVADEAAVEPAFEVSEVVGHLSSPRSPREEAGDDQATFQTVPEVTPTEHSEIERELESPESESESDSDVDDEMSVDYQSEGVASVQDLDEDDDYEDEPDDEYDAQIEAQLTIDISQQLNRTTDAEHFASIAAIEDRPIGNLDSRGLVQADLSTLQKDRLELDRDQLLDVGLNDTKADELVGLDRMEVDESAATAAVAVINDALHQAKSMVPGAVDMEDHNLASQKKDISQDDSKEAGLEGVKESAPISEEATHAEGRDPEAEVRSARSNTPDATSYLVLPPPSTIEDEHASNGQLPTPEATQLAATDMEASGADATVETSVGRLRKVAVAEADEPHEAPHTPAPQPIHATRMSTRSTTRAVSAQQHSPESAAVTPGSPPSTRRQTRSRRTRSISIVLDGVGPPQGADVSGEMALESPSTPVRSEASMAGSPHADPNIRLQLTKSFRTNLSDFTPLQKLRVKLGSKLDVLGIVANNPSEPQRSRGGPRHYQLTFNITDVSIGPSGVANVTIFRPHIEALPHAEPGDGILLRSFDVVSIKNRGFGLKSTDTSSWAVFRADGNVDIRGPPVEFGDGERSHIALLKSWYQGLDKTGFAKLDRANNQQSPGRTPNTRSRGPAN